MDTLQSFNDEEDYRAEVFNFGGLKPDFAINNRNDDIIDWTDVHTDGKGNVKSMPLLRSKLCFGRIEYLVRHGHPEQKPVNKGPYQGTKETKCNRCPAKTKEGCHKLVAERIARNPNINLAYNKWLEAGKKADNDPNPQSRAHKRYNRFDGPIFGELWDNVLDAISDHGPFTNSNDDAVRDEIYAKRERKRVAAAKKKREVRRVKRLECKSEQQVPPKQFSDAAWDECNKRSAQLKAARKLPKVHSRIAKLTDEGCDFTALAWYYEIMQTAMGEKTKPGSMAKWLTEETAYHCGKSYDTLKDRLRHDLKRARDIDAGKFGNIWQEFDPDADLGL
ncbi:hypothetical protein [Parasphingorhabdus sp.]|uniref:hypothetical protein n=1 Tax=Parasphingorhabdus sp. TaxID=2709688 RepID=UPI003D27FE7A